MNSSTNLEDECERANNDLHTLIDGNAISTLNVKIDELKNVIREHEICKKTKWDIYCENCFKYNVPPVSLLKDALEMKNEPLDLSVNSVLVFRL